MRSSLVGNASFQECVLRDILLFGAEQPANSGFADANMTTTVQKVSYVLGALLFLVAVTVQSRSADQATSNSLTDRISPKQGLEGWLALFDGKSTFGFQDGKLDDSRKPSTLQGGTTTSEFSDYELHVLVVKAGNITLGVVLTSQLGSTDIKRPTGPICAPSTLTLEMGCDWKKEHFNCRRTTPKRNLNSKAFG